MDDFPRNRSSKTGRQAYCKPCWNVTVNEHKNRRYGSERSFLLNLRYGIDEVTFEWLSLRQDGLCAICRKAPAEHVDHDHETKQVRGLLCFGCNRGLGKAQDDPALLRRGMAYLRRHERTEPG